MLGKLKQAIVEGVKNFRRRHYNCLHVGLENGIPTSCWKDHEQGVIKYIPCSDQSGHCASFTDRRDRQS